MKNKMKVYEFLYNSCVYESSAYTVSVHRTKLGAFNAMRKHKFDAYMEWYNDRITYGKMGSVGRNKFGCMESWGIGEMEVLD